MLSDNTVHVGGQISAEGARKCCGSRGRRKPFIDNTFNGWPNHP